MDSPKYLIIITLIDGQNFNIPEGLSDRVDATVFVEARFGNESILKSDHIKLTNSNPEFVTELAWQLDKKTLHQLRVERRAIKLQVFLQTQERKKPKKNPKPSENLAADETRPGESNVTHKVELIGYTILDIRSAQERDNPKFQWLPLLNPKFRKSSYNRPEIQLAVTLSRLDENADPAHSLLEQTSVPTSTESSRESNIDDPIRISEVCNEPEANTSTDSRLYKTCLDITHNPNQPEKDEILDNDINIRCQDGIFYIYDSRNKDKPSMDDCDERYRISVMIPFNSELDSLVEQVDDTEMYYFLISLFQTSLRTDFFKNLTCVETKEVQFDILTTDANILSTYFEIYPTLVIKLHQSSGKTLGITTIQLDQLCRSDRKRRSIEGIFAIQSMLESEPSSIHPSIGVSVILERLNDDLNLEEHQAVSQTTRIDNERKQFGDEIDDILFNSTFNDTHQLTLENTRVEEYQFKSDGKPILNGISMADDDHHFCFTIDLKNFTYTSTQRLIPTLRELVVRYSYPFFGYKDTITTDSSIPISPTKSIIISGFCEFNFATTTSSLLAALEEIPLNLEILACENAKMIESEFDHEERLVATCNINLAEMMEFNESNLSKLKDKGLSAKVSAPIFAINGNEIGQLEIYLCLRDLGKPCYDLKSSVEESERGVQPVEQDKNLVPMSNSHQADLENLSSFVNQTKTSMEAWKQSFLNKFEDDQRKRENERFKRLYQRIEAKDARRDQEFRRKMDDLDGLEKKLKASYNHVVTLGDRLTHTLEQLKNKNVPLESRIEALDLKFSKALITLKSDMEKKFDAVQHQGPPKSSVDFRSTKTAARVAPELSQPRRSSLQGIPVPLRSSSLVRASGDGVATKIVVGRPKSIVTTVVNGYSNKNVNARLSKGNLMAK